jgi:hypothetical protein
MEAREWSQHNLVIALQHAYTVVWLRLTFSVNLLRLQDVSYYLYIFSNQTICLLGYLPRSYRN